ncbi:TadA family conjugal transfer-associated ATPase [Kutzneria sp. CA-103260]|uniref:TadA family conjugal transfer-associated ATPase n=1 Tax=Kutzneria sp. CA-103260 TaxID=2802641 RepID=UPI001BA70595|nr:TadA family conjugal transfer-associated ATPase [Kutzneria sp. CA-103260]QUQ69708.1 pilus assembly protein CpaF [Kutzneria sp. CA-103260]
MRRDLVDRVRERLAVLGSDVTDAVVADAFRAETGGVASDLDTLGAVRELRQEFSGTGPLAPLLRDPEVTDVLVTGPDRVWIDGPDGLRRATVSFRDDDSVRRLAQRLALAAGRRLDDAQPFVDAWLPDGMRMHAMLPPVAADGTCLSLRVIRPAGHDLAKLRGLGAFDEATEDLLIRIVRARLAFLVIGATGSGKTTLLAALLAQVPAAERIVCIEDAGELHPDHPQVVRLVSRPPNVEGAGEVTTQELVRQALRMRPDRIVVGEVRGAEVCELLAALNTGHDGGAGTVHANSPSEVPARMEALAALGGVSRPALHSQLAAAIRVVLHLKRCPDGPRRLVEIGLLTRTPDDVVIRSAWLDGHPAAAWPDLTALLAERGFPC